MRKRDGNGQATKLKKGEGRVARRAVAQSEQVVFAYAQMYQVGFFAFS